ncbi:precorrin-3B synthase [Actinoplanes campanulatus]|uniref:Precorrin-3B synthase n=1 Tax=Actinoplanes campanulatus TaxID=113559 RepID=A0A7W5FC24_9ACTN|nr:precorrin-3B synthase [Actinoplanes campanulatus]MBB3092771.1 precorrin-3B synthase [Actinoplanes campanulatus]GGM98924.1 precorrin-3B synthase [Actinoplanes campanulatus]GID34132.1 precorrin-3B synthase [Actinoplanes campanulatus]
MSPVRTSDTDACPGALRLHAAADGLLARVRLPGGLLTGARLRTLRELAEEFGDGALELTSRANLQLRGLSAIDAPALATRLRAAGLLPSQTHDNVRNIASPPLPGSTIRALIPALDRAILDDPVLAGLPGKFLFALGHVPLSPDVAAVPVPTGPTPPAPTIHAGFAGSGDRGRTSGGLFAIRFAGHDTGLRVEGDRVVPALIAAAHAFLAEREEQRGDGPAAWRLRELTDGPARVSARVAGALRLTPVALAAAVPVEATDATDLVGVVAQEDGLAAVGALVPLGRLTGVPLRVLEEADQLVVTPWRGVIVADLPPSAAPGWAGRLAAAGLAVAADSPWSGVTACAGRPGCAKSLADVRADATATARFVDGLPVHWVGCARACGSPSGPHVRVEATADGYLVARTDGDRSGPAHPPGTTNAESDRNGPTRPPGTTGSESSRSGLVGPPGMSGAEGDGSGLVGPSTAGAGSPRISGVGTAVTGLGEIVAVARRP